MARVTKSNTAKKKHKKILKSTKGHYRTAKYIAMKSSEKKLCPPKNLIINAHLEVFQDTGTSHWATSKTESLPWNQTIKGRKNWGQNTCGIVLKIKRL